VNSLRLQSSDLQAQRESARGRERKRAEQQLEQAAQFLDEMNKFAATMERLAHEGYKPAPEWIDDGIILRLVPLWELIPLWKGEPQKHWGGLRSGDFDWSHIAMRYWPERVQEKCQQDKSYAIAHGHEEWYAG